MKLILQTSLTKTIFPVPINFESNVRIAGHGSQGININSFTMPGPRPERFKNVEYGHMIGTSARGGEYVDLRLIIKGLLVKYMDDTDEVREAFEKIEKLANGLLGAQLAAEVSMKCPFAWHIGLTSRFQSAWRDFLNVGGRDVRQDLMARKKIEQEIKEQKEAGGDGAVKPVCWADGVPLTLDSGETNIAKNRDPSKHALLVVDGVPLKEEWIATHT